MTADPTPAECAARMTPAQKRALFNMPTDLSPNSCRTRLLLYLYGLQISGRLTPLGAEVRAILAAKEPRA